MQIQSDNLDANYWDNRYKVNDAGWDMGKVSPPLQAYIDQLTNKDISILIPGCGNAYEAEYLLKNGFKNITLIDIAPELVLKLKDQFQVYPNDHINIICGDFFDLENQFDLILEQTFFCAINPDLREKYAEKMYSLLKPKGKLVGVFFNRNFEGGPPFSCNKAEYVSLFKNRFKIAIIRFCYTSIKPRSGSELFIKLIKL